MGALVDWGTGFFVNSGNGIDDDWGDVGDRVAFTTPLAGLLWTALYEISASGPSTEALRPEIRPAVDLDPSDDVRTVAFSVAKWDLPATRDRRLRARRTTLNLGLVGSHRWQTYDLIAGDVPSFEAPSSETSPRGWPTRGCAPTSARSPLKPREPSWASRSRTPRSTPRRRSTWPSRGDSSAASHELNTAAESASSRASRRASRRATTTRAWARGRAAPWRDRATLRRAPVRPHAHAPRHDDQQLQVPPELPRRPDLVAAHPRHGHRRHVRAPHGALSHRSDAHRRGRGAIFSTALERNSTPSGAAPLGVEADLGILYEQEHRVRAPRLHQSSSSRSRASRTSCRVSTRRPRTRSTS